jgi:DNA polymerase V
MFALIDANNFYCTCESIFRPDLKGKAIVVISNNDGCIISRSAEAKKLDIPMGAPYFKIKDELRRQGVTVFSSNYALYADMSHRMMATLEEIGPRLDIYSIDEAFMDLSGVDNCLSFSDFGHEIRDTVLRNTGLRVGVGIAPTKTLAKLANFAAKKWPTSQGVVDISGHETQRKLLPHVPIEEVWGVGRRISKKLRGMGIENALQLADCSTWVIRKHFNVVLERTMRELRGEACLAFDELIPTKQQIICSRSFGHRITDYAEMHQAICTYAERAAEKLRMERQYCRQVSIFMRSSPHAPGEPYYSNQVSMSCMTPTEDTRDIISMTNTLLLQIWRAGYRYMKAGVMLSDFYSQGIAQPDFFDELKPRANSAALMDVIDTLNKSGKRKVWFAGQGIEKSWSMKREMLSPAWTTRYSDFPVVK